MKIPFFLFTVAWLFMCLTARSQNYNNIANYYVNGSPVNGIKIKTNLPFTTSSQMPTIILQGYNYASSSTIGLQICYYVYGVAPDTKFLQATISSFGSFIPPVTLAEEGGKVVIFIDDKQSYTRFTVSAFAQGRPQEIPANFQGWTVVDEALTGNSQLLLPYKNNFSGIVKLPGSGIWNDAGNVGIGTTDTKGYKLAVNGSAVATSMTVKLNSAWPDFVFKDDYLLPDLGVVKQYVQRNHHLPDMPSAKEVSENGVDLGEMNKILTKKVEELTLYLIEQNKRIDEQQKQINLLTKNKR